MAGSKNGEHFIYPDICVTEDLHQSLYNDEGRAITDKFMNDLKQLLPQVCSRKLQVYNQPSPINVSASKEPKTSELPASPKLMCQASAKPSLSYLPLTDTLENNKQTTTRISPTPSITGRKRVIQTNVYDNIKRIKKIHSLKPTSYQHSTLTAQCQAKPFDVTLQPSSTSSFLFDNQFKMTETQLPLNIFSKSVLTKNNNSQYLFDMGNSAPIQQSQMINFRTSKISKKSMIQDKENIPVLERMDI